MAIAKTGENEPENTVSIVRRVSKQTVLTVLTQTAPFLVSMIRLERPAPISIRIRPCIRPDELSGRMRSLSPSQGRALVFYQSVLRILR